MFHPNSIAVIASQTADSRQQTADSRQLFAKSFALIFFSIMMLSFTSFYSSSLWAQAAPCTCPTGWGSVTLLFPITCANVEVNVCCSPPGTFPPQARICNVTTPLGFCNPPTPSMFDEIADAIVDRNPCGFPCNNIPSSFIVTGPCRAKVSIQNINGVLRNVIDWADSCSNEPCYHTYEVTCDDFGHITKTKTGPNHTSCDRLLKPSGPDCYNVCY